MNIAAAGICLHDPCLYPTRARYGHQGERPYGFSSHCHHVFSFGLETKTKQSLELPCPEYLTRRDLAEIGGVHVQVGISKQRFVQHVVRVYSQLESLRLADAHGLACAHIETEAAGG